MAGDTLRRVYFALWPDAAVRAAVVAATAEAVAHAGGRAVPPASLHVTLAFLGEQSPPRVDAALAAARGVTFVAGEQGFERVAAWGRGGPLVLEAARVTPALARLRSALANALLAADFQLDRREFRPHITLAREPARRVVAGAVRVAWPFTHFVLVESRQEAGGSRYSIVERFAAR